MYRLNIGKCISKNICRYWSQIDELIREAVVLRGVKVRLLISFWKKTHPLTFNFVTSLKSLCMQLPNCSLEVVGESVEDVTLSRCTFLSDWIKFASWLHRGFSVTRNRRRTFNWDSTTTSTWWPTMLSTLVCNVESVLVDAIYNTIACNRMDLTASVHFQMDKPLKQNKNVQNVLCDLIASKSLLKTRICSHVQMWEAIKKCLYFSWMKYHTKQKSDSTLSYHIKSQ